MKAAVVFLRNGSYYLRAYAMTTAGVWIGDGPCLVAPGEASDVQIGDAVLAALDNSWVGIAHPTDWKDVSDAVLKAAAVKSWRTFSRGARAVEVFDEASVVRFLPTRTVGSSGGSLHMPDAAVEVHRPTTSGLLGAALRRALDKCE